MRDYPFNSDSLFNFSLSRPYTHFDSMQEVFFQKLNDLKEKYHFPAIENDIGSLLKFLVCMNNSKIIFEMGSGYGHSAFWYTLNESTHIEKIILTEKRDDLQEEFHKLPWDPRIKDKITYHQADAFEVLKEVEEIDFLLIDGVKADYKKFLEEARPKLSKNSLVLIDNSYWRGSFLDPSMVHKKSASNIKELHEYIAVQKHFEAIFIPYRDGVTLLRKLSF